MSIGAVSSGGLVSVIPRRELSQSVAPMPQSEETVSLGVKYDGTPWSGEDPYLTPTGYWGCFLPDFWEGDTSPLPTTVFSSQEVVRNVVGYSLDISYTIEGGFFKKFFMLMLLSGEIHASSLGDLGSIQNRFDSTISNLESIQQTTQVAQSRLLDTDFAEEVSRFTRAQILQQAGIAILAQANAAPFAVLELLLRA